MGKIDGLVSSTIGSVVNGISQQPPTVRLPSQAEAQENMVSSIVDGVSLRPPTESVNTLHTNGVPAKGFHDHVRDRDEIEQYLVQIEDGDVNVFNLLTGNEVTVNEIGSALSYLDITGPSAQDAYAVVSVADFTFVVNKETSVAMSGSVTPAIESQFLYYQREATGATVTFTATLGAVTRSATLSTIPATSGGMIDKLLDGTDGIFHVNFFPGWTFDKIGQTAIHGHRTGDFAIGVFSDNFSDEVYEVATQKIAKFNDLPPVGPDGYTVEVTGTDGDEEDNYWVKFTLDGRAWEETVGPEEDNVFDASTLPHQLTRVSGTGDSAVFEFAEVNWEDRLKGDIDSAQEPTFVGEAIRDLVFHKNRLGFLVQESVVLSEAGEFFNFWPTTVTTIIDSDPIDVAATNNRVALLDFAVPFDGDLYLFSGDGAVQNVLKGGDNLTVKNANISEASAFASSPRVRPVSVGKSIYFAVDRGEFTAISEFIVNTDGVVDADDVTSHVPEYIPGNVTRIAASQEESILTLLSADDSSSLYVYRYFYVGNKKLQSSWSRWNFHADDVILSVHWVKEKLYLVIDRSGDIELEVMAFRDTATGDLDFRIHLDSLTTQPALVVTFDSATLKTTINPPFDPRVLLGNYRMILTGDHWTTRQGEAVTLPDPDGSGNWVIEGNFANIEGQQADVHVGRIIPWEYEFTEPVREQASPSGQGDTTPVTQGRLQIRNWKVLFRDTGAFTARVGHKLLPDVRDRVTQFGFEAVGTWTGISGTVTLDDEGFQGANSLQLASGGSMSHVMRNLNLPAVDVRGKILEFWTNIENTPEEVQRIRLRMGSDATLGTNDVSFFFIPTRFLLGDWQRWELDTPDTAPQWDSNGTVDFQNIKSWELGFDTFGTPATVRVRFDWLTLGTDSPAEFLYQYSGLFVGQSVTGPQRPVAEDDFTFDVRGESKHVRVRLTGENHLPVTIVGAEWEGFEVSRSSKV